MSLLLRENRSRTSGPRSCVNSNPALTTTNGEVRMAECSYHSEEWRPIPDFPQYEVSNFGRVRNRNHKGCGPRLLRPGNVRGYQCVALSRDGKMFNRKVHRLVLEVFVGPCPDGYACAHNDGDRANNRLGNLRWATCLENAQDRQKHGTQLRGETSGKSKLTEELVSEIRNSTESGAAVARRLSLAKTTISAVRRRLTWRHIP